MDSGKTKNLILNIVKSILIPVIVYLFFKVIAGNRFGSSRGMMMIFRQAVPSVILAYAMTTNMLMGMMDLSVGAIMLVSGIIAGNLTIRLGTGIPGLVIGCVIVSLAMLMLNYYFYRKFKVPYMVLAIGVVLIYETLSRLIFGGKGVMLPFQMNKLAQSPYCFIIMAIVFVVFYVVYNFTTFGHDVRALGNGGAVASDAGVIKDKIQFLSFLFSGILLGVASVMNISTKGILTVVANMESVTPVFDAMMGILLGFFLSRFCNLSFGILIGIISMKMLNSGLVAMGLSTTVMEIATGIFLLVILAISSNQGRFTHWREMRKRREVALQEIETTG